MKKKTVSQAQLEILKGMLCKLLLVSDSLPPGPGEEREDSNRTEDLFHYSSGSSERER